MAITEDDIKQQICLEVGDVNPSTGDPATSPGQPGSDGIVWSRIDYLWDRYAAWDQIAPGLRELYCRYSGIKLVLGVLNPRRLDSSDTQAGFSVRANQLWEHYASQLNVTANEIARARRSAASSAGQVAGQGGPYQGGLLARRTPIPSTGEPDPNAVRYGGIVGDRDPMSDDDVTS